MPNESGIAICPNPKCHKKIEEPIVLSDVSTTPVERYYACPHCLFKLDVLSVQHLKEVRARKKETPIKPLRRKEKEEEKKKEEPLVKPPQKKEKGPSKCSGYIGYLATLPKNKPIPQECLICPKVLDCVMKTSDSQ